MRIDARIDPGSTSHVRSTASPCRLADPAGLVARVQRRDEEPAGDEHEHDAREAEEANEVDLHAAAVDPEPERDRDDDAEDRAAAGHRRARRLLERGGEEHGRLEALADHGEERHADERAAGAARERARDRLLQIAAQVAGVAAHPDDHVGHRCRGDERDQRLELLLLALGEVLVEHLERDSEADAEEDRDADAGPHRAQRIPRPAAERKVAMMTTISVASRPSRRPMTKVGSTC